jgi:hypothetical protein
VLLYFHFLIYVHDVHGDNVMLPLYKVVLSTLVLHINVFIIGPQMQYIVSKRIIYLVAYIRYLEYYSLICCLENGRDERIVCETCFFTN